MLDWSKIDSYYIFQRLVNYLFALECNSPEFIPSSPYIGADGAWDGYYNDYYDYEKKEGLWSIQSKWTKKSGDDAFRYLRGKIKDELRKAKRKNVDHLRIATNAELRIEHVNGLQELNTGEVATLRVWCREELERRIVLQPYLRYYFFGSPQYPIFVPSNEYFSRIEKHLLPLSVTEISRFEGYIEKAKLFILSESQHILLVQSPGGYGKSHLLREIAQITHQIDHERQAWMIKPGHRIMQDAIGDEVITGRKYLLIFDDADRFLDEVEPLLSFSKHEGNDIKVIFTLRTSGFRSIYAIIARLRCEGIYDGIRIADWTKDELIQLLRLVTDKKEVNNEETIVTLYPNPFLIVWIGKQIKNQPTLDFEEIKEKFVNDVEYETQRCSGDILKTSRVRDFITNLACIIPFSEEDKRILEILGQDYELSADEVEEIIHNLKDAGVLRVIGKSLRFNPDMKGDLYLAYNLGKNTNSKKLGRLIEKWFPISAEKVFINLEAAAKYAGKEPFETTLSEIVDFWAEDAESASGFKREQVLGLVEKIASIVPKSCLNLMHNYLDLDAPPSDDPQLKAWKLENITPTTDNYGPVITKLMRITSVRRELLEIIEKIELKSKRGYYDNYKPISLIKDAVSPLYNGPSVILTTLDTLSEWLNEPNDHRIAMISEALSEVLAASHRYTEPAIGGMTYGERMLEDAPEIRDIRNRAVQILKRMINYSSLEVKLAAINVVRRIGTGNLGGMPEGEIPLSQKITTERKEILEEVGQLVSPETEIRLLNAIENLFLDWWIWKEPGADKAKDYLLKFPRSPEYIAFRFFASPDHVVVDFGSEESQAPSGNRWRWFLDNPIRDSYPLTPEDFRELIDSLRNKYCTEVQIVEFLKELEREISPCDPWAHPPIITRWVELESESFVSIRNNNDLWKEVPDRFKGEIDTALTDLNKEFISKLAYEVLTELPDTPIFQVETFLIVLQKHQVSESLLNSWLLELLERGNPETKAVVVRRLGFIFRKSKNFDLLLRLLHVAIFKEQLLKDAMITYLSITANTFHEQFASIEGTIIEDFRRELLCKLKDAPMLDWHAERLLAFAFESIDSVIDFVEYRLRKIKEIRDRKIKDQKYDAIPFEGIECIKEQIKSFEDYEKFLESVICWYEEDPYWSNFELKHLMKHISSLLNNQTEKMYLEEYITKQLEMHNLEKAMGAAVFLPFHEGTIPIFVRIAEESITAGESKKVKRLLHSKRYPGVISSRPGEAPHALVSLKNLFQEMNQESKKRKVKEIIEKCIEAIDKEMEWYKEKDEEFLNPRG